MDRIRSRKYKYILVKLTRDKCDNQNLRLHIKKTIILCPYKF